MALSPDDIDVAVSEDGRMVAAGWRGYFCSDCECYHIDLLDKAGRPFAALVIENEDLVEMSDILRDVAASQGMVRERMQ